MEMRKDRRNTIRKERGDRVKQIRLALGLSRKKLSFKYPQYKFSSNTLQSWEEGRWGGITEDSAEKLCTIFKSEGAEINIEWLLHGSGLKPAITALNATEEMELPMTTLIHKELHFFRSLHENTLDTIVPDDTMLPYLHPGDYIAGKIYAHEKIKLALGLPCILTLPGGKLLVRILEVGDKSDRFDLLCANPRAANAKQSLRNVTVINAAPVIWIRRPLTLGPAPAVPRRAMEEMKKRLTQEVLEEEKV